MKEKGFTLIELLAIIVILTVIATVVMPSAFTMIRKAKDNSYKAITDSFEESAKLYVTRHRDVAEKDLDLYNYYTITLNDLKSDGLLTKANLVDPRTNQNVDLSKKIIVTREADMSLTICFEDRGCYIPTLLTNELTKEGNIVSGSIEGLHHDPTNGFYYYMGVNPKNWLEFDNFLWRIIKINPDGSTKLIYEGPKNKEIKDQTGTLGSKTFADTNTNTFSKTTSLSTYLQGFYTSNIQEKNKSKIQPKKWCVGKTSYSTSGTAKGTFLSNECSAQTIDNLNVGVLAASDYLYASLDATCLSAYKTSGDNGNSCKNNNYLYKSSYNYWSINGDSTTTNVWIVNKLGSLGAPVAANTTAEVRPVINLIPSVLISKGDGTHDNPYTIKDTVNVDREKPIITILGSNPIVLDKGDSYSDAGATATDSVDGNLTSKIITVSNVNTNIAGNYTVTYTVSDRSGNKRIAIRSVSVVEKDIANAPSITTGMIPVKWNGTNWITTTSSDTDWYNYNTTDKKWANVVTVNPNYTIIKDLSGNGYDGVLMNGASFGDGGLLLDGVDDYVELPPLSATDDWKNGVTIEFTAKWDAFNSWSRIFDFANGAGVDNILACNIGTSTDAEVGFHDDAAHSNSSDNWIATATTTKAAYKAVITKSGTSYNFVAYKDGVQTASTSFVDSNFLMNIKRIYNYIGKSNWPDAYFDGTINSLKITQANGRVILNYDFTNSAYYGSSSTYFNNFAGRSLPTSLVNTMWVWVPRYIYKISSGWHSNTTGTIDVKFSRGTDDTLGGLVPLVNTGSATDSNGTWTSQPAFNFGTKQLTGMWVAKFEATAAEGVANGYTSDWNCPIAGDNVSTKTIKIIPNVQSWRCINYSNIFQATRNMETNNFYGWGTTGNGIDTHLIKNTEWGAVAYLSKSAYGKNSQEIWLNNSQSYITGCDGNSVYDSPYNGCQNSYSTTNGLEASSTGTIYGIYDLSGGSWEHVAAYVHNGNDSLSNGTAIVNADIKYKNIYSVGSPDDLGPNYALTINQKGDAIYETSSSGLSTNDSWYSDHIDMPRTSWPWLGRGGSFNEGAGAGLFYLNGHLGWTPSSYGFRPVLLVESGL